MTKPRPPGLDDGRVDDLSAHRQVASVAQHRVEAHEEPFDRGGPGQLIAITRSRLVRASRATLAAAVREQPGMAEHLIEHVTVCTSGTVDFQGYSPNVPLLLPKGRSANDSRYLFGPDNRLQRDIAGTLGNGAWGYIVGTYDKGAGTNNQRYVSGVAGPFNGHIDEFRIRISSAPTAGSRPPGAT